MKKKDEIKVCLVGSSGGHLTHLYMLMLFLKMIPLRKEEKRLGTIFMNIMMQTLQKGWQNYLDCNR